MEILEVDLDQWEILEDDGVVILPFTDLRNILANRLRWIDYAKVHENE